MKSRKNGGRKTGKTETAVKRHLPSARLPLIEGPDTEQAAEIAQPREFEFEFDGRLQAPVCKGHEKGKEDGQQQEHGETEKFGARKPMTAIQV
jgi:hypothetical protein